MADRADKTSKSSASSTSANKTKSKLNIDPNEPQELTGKNRLGLTPPKRINVANKAVADELLVSQNLLYLQQDDYYKAQEHIQVVSQEVDALKVVIKKKQDLINRLQQGISDRDYKIEELQKAVAGTHVERTSFKVLEEQNASLILKVTTTGRQLEELQRELRAKIEEQKDVREFSDAKVKNAIKTEVMLQSTIQQLGYNLTMAEQTKEQTEATRKALQGKMQDLSQHLQMVSETSKEELYRSRQTEYRTLRRLDEMTTKFVAERDEKDLLRDTVKLASMRGDVLANRLGDALEKTEGQQLMVQSIVRQVENSNDALRAREKQLEKQNMHLTAQLRLSQMAVGDMLRRYKIAESAVEAGRIEVYELKQALKPKRKGEVRVDASAASESKTPGDTQTQTQTQTQSKKKKPPGMAGSTTANANKVCMEKLAALTSDSAKQMFPRDKTLHGTISNSILSGPYDDEADRFSSTGNSYGDGNSDGKSRSINNGANTALQDVMDATDAEAAAAMQEYNSFIYDDNNSVGSHSTFQSDSMGRLDGGRAMYGGSADLGMRNEVPSQTSSRSGQASVSGSSFGGANASNASYGGAGAIFSGNASVAQISAGGLSGGLPIFDYSTASAGGAGGAGGTTRGVPGAPAAPLPLLLEEQEAQAAGKASLLSAYLRMAISIQNHNSDRAGSSSSNGEGSHGTKTLPLLHSSSGSSAVRVLDFVRCELCDDELKKIVDLLRLLSLKEFNTIDLRHNHFTIKAVDVISAFIVSIAGADLQRSAPLEIDLRHNHFSAKAIERLCTQLRQPSRPEVKLVASEENNQVILLYGLNRPLLKIDCRNNSEDVRKTKKSLKQRIGLGANVSDSLLVAFPGDDMAARNPNYFEGTIYPRDEIMNTKLIV